MKRGEFLRRSLLATVGLAILPIPEIFPQCPKLKQLKVYTFKVSNQILMNEKLFSDMISKEIKTLETKGHLVSYEVGYQYDDFVKNLHTVRIELT